MTGVENMKVKGVDNLIYSTITSNLDGSTMIIEINATNSASFSVICSTNDTCKIKCYSDNACTNLNLYCDGICYIDCDALNGIDCPSVTGNYYFGSGPTPMPSQLPSTIPSAIPSTDPTELPSKNPSKLPTGEPSTLLPSESPSFDPTQTPSHLPSPIPTQMPSKRITQGPSAIPTIDPSGHPTYSISTTQDSVPIFSISTSHISTKFETSIKNTDPDSSAGRDNGKQILDFKQSTIVIGVVAVSVFIFLVIGTCVYLCFCYPNKKHKAQLDYELELARIKSGSIDSTTSNICNNGGDFVITRDTNTQSQNSSNNNGTGGNAHVTSNNVRTGELEVKGTENVAITTDAIANEEGLGNITGLKC